MNKEVIYIAADHAGYNLKEKLKEEMTQKYSNGDIAKVKTNKRYLDALKD